MNVDPELLCVHAYAFVTINGNYILTAFRCFLRRQKRNVVFLTAVTNANVCQKYPNVCRRLRNHSGEFRGKLSGLMLNTTDIYPPVKFVSGKMFAFKIISNL